MQRLLMCQLFYLCTNYFTVEDKSEVVFDVKQSIPFQVGLIHHTMLRLGNKKLLEIDCPFTMDQMPIFMAIYWCPSLLTQQEVATITHRDKGSVARTISFMKMKELVDIKQDKVDKRKNRLHKTRKGETLFKKITTLQEQFSKDLQAMLPTADVTLFLDNLKQISSALLERLHADGDVCTIQNYLKKM